jgi:hypothetical protein
MEFDLVATLNLMTFAAFLALAGRELWLVRNRREDDVRA